MKKTLIALALAAIVAPAWGADVVSSNIVGYEKVQLRSGYNMIGVQFAQVGGENLSLADVGTLDSSMQGFDEDGNYQTKMEVWTGNGYKTYGWSGTSAGEYMDDSSLNNKWLDVDYEDDASEVIAGSGFWVKAEKAGEMTIAGQVPTSATNIIALVSGYNIVANPYPGAVVISEFGQLDSTFDGFDEDGNYQTKMEVWTGNGYTTYGWSGTSAGEYMDDASLNNKWLNVDYEAVETTIPFGTAVWIKAGSAGNITFISPISSAE